MILVCYEKENLEIWLSVSNLYFDYQNYLTIFAKSFANLTLGKYKNNKNNIKIFIFISLNINILNNNYENIRN
jgi:hypothetical protein